MSYWCKKHDLYLIFYVIYGKKREVHVLLTHPTFPNNILCLHNAPISQVDFKHIEKRLLHKEDLI